MLKNQPDILGLQRVPNARIDTEIKTLEWLTHAKLTKTVALWRKTLSKHQSVAIDLEALWKLTEELPYDVVISWASSESHYDVLFTRRAERAPQLLVFAEKAIRPKPWHHYANNPLQNKFFIEKNNPDRG